VLACFAWNPHSVEFVSVDRFEYVAVFEQLIPAAPSFFYESAFETYAAWRFGSAVELAFLVLAFVAFFVCAVFLDLKGDCIEHVLDGLACLDQSLDALIHSIVTLYAAFAIIAERCAAHELTRVTTFSGGLLSAATFLLRVFLADVSHAWLVAMTDPRHVETAVTCLDCLRLWVRRVEGVACCCGFDCLRSERLHDVVFVHGEFDATVFACIASRAVRSVHVFFEPCGILVDAVGIPRAEQFRHRVL